ncbi:signal peptidase I [Gracilimonas halophila]|uniref:Signal peptidase I n=1 Tax=Gracilimonas halophila TaxID=1834464 RepID=A0ABW5JK15_9BACT
MKTRGRKPNRFQLVQKKAFPLLLGFIVLVLLVLASVTKFSIYRVQGNSMFDTIHQGDIILIWKKFKSKNVFKRNDIVLFYYEINDEVIPYVKRITAIPNDIIKINSDKLVIDEQSYPHDGLYYLISGDTKTKGREYLTYLMDQSFECVEEHNFKIKTISSSTIFSIPNRCYFLIGDNPHESMDSRFFGFIHEDHIVGKVIAVF